MERADSIILACGALSHELVALKRQFGWENLAIQCLPAELHNRPEQIVPKLEPLIQKAQLQYDNVLIGYADCGTGGRIDSLARKYNLQRLPGAHCYEFFATTPLFERLSNENLGTFYLTDFLARHFERLMIRGYKLDKHPELKDMLFSNYTKMVYLTQIEHPERLKQAEAAAQWLGVPLEIHHTGYGDLGQSVSHFLQVTQ